MWSKIGIKTNIFRDVFNETNSIFAIRDGKTLF